MCRGRGAGPKLLVRRRFRTREEVRDRLQGYADELEKELTAVEERIDALRTDGDDAGEGAS